MLKKIKTHLDLMQELENLKDSKFIRRPTMESYILYNVYFNIPISEKEEEIKFTKFSEKFVDNITVKKVNLDENNKGYIRRIQINFRDEYLKEKDIVNIESFLIEFLYKFTLQTNSFFLFFIEQERKIHNKKILKDYINIEDEISFSEDFSKYKSDVVLENIKFKKYKDKYFRIIKILELIEESPAVVFLILYDFFLECLSQKFSKKKKQNIVVNYIKSNVTILEKQKYIGFIKYNFTINPNNNCEEDDLTKLRNDIAHAEERVDSKILRNLNQKAKYLIKPLVYVITFFFKNN